jgi:hypothetical protein
MKINEFFINLKGETTLTMPVGARIVKALIRDIPTINTLGFGDYKTELVIVALINEKTKKTKNHYFLVANYETDLTQYEAQRMVYVDSVLDPYTSNAKSLHIFEVIKGPQGLVDLPNWQPDPPPLRVR